MRLIDPEQTLDIYVTNLLEYHERCSAQSVPIGRQTDDLGEYLWIPAPPLYPETGATTSRTGTPASDEAIDPEPPMGGWDEEEDPRSMSAEDAAAWDACVPRFGEI